MAPQIVRLPDGTLWLVNDGIGHQITGDRQSMWARIMYGQPAEQDEADWETGPTVLELYGGPGGIEQVAQGLKPDPIGWWRVRNSTPTNILSDHTHVVDQDGFHYLVSPDGRAWKATGEGQIRSLDAEWGEATPIGQTPGNVVGSVAGAGAADLFRPNEIEVLSGLVGQQQIDGTTGDDEISVRLPGLTPRPAPNPDPAETNSPGLADQVTGARSDRTPGLALNPIREAEPPGDPTVPVDTTDPDSGGTPPEAGTPGTGGVHRPARPTPATQGSPTGPRPARPTPATQGSPTGPRPDRTGSGSVGRPDRTGSGSVGRPARTQTASQVVNRAARTTLPDSVLRPRRLPPPRFDRVRGFLDRTGGDTSWLDQIERQGR